MILPVPTATRSPAFPAQSSRPSVRPPADADAGRTFPAGRPAGATRAGKPGSGTGGASAAGSTLPARPTPAAQEEGRIQPPGRFQRPRWTRARFQTKASVREARRPRRGLCREIASRGRGRGRAARLMARASPVREPTAASGARGSSCGRAQLTRLVPALTTRAATTSKLQACSLWARVRPGSRTQQSIRRPYKNSGRALG
jgi:hypothetical protein